MTADARARDDRLGEVVRDGDRVGLRYVRHLAHPPERVWRALTDSTELAHWFPCDLVGDRIEGAELRMPFRPDHLAHYVPDAGIEDVVLEGRILTWDPPRTFAWTWDADELTWELAPVDGGTQLVLTLWPGEAAPDDLVGAGAGFHLCLDQLGALLDDGAVVHRPLEEVRALERRYAAEVIVPPPMHSSPR